MVGDKGDLKLRVWLSAEAEGPDLLVVRCLEQLSRGVAGNEHRGCSLSDHCPDRTLIEVQLTPGRGGVGQPEQPGRGAVPYPVEVKT